MTTCCFKKRFDLEFLKSLFYFLSCIVNIEDQTFRTSLIIPFLLDVHLIINIVQIFKCILYFNNKVTCATHMHMHIPYIFTYV